MKLKKRLCHWIKKHYGHRCPDWEVGCPICDKWQAYDALFVEQDQDTVQQQIEALERMIQWRKEFLIKTQA